MLPKTATWLLAAPLLLALSCADMTGEGFSANTSAVTSGVPSAPGGYRLRFQQATGQQRAYILYLPPGYDATRPQPYSLYLLLHGSGQSATRFANTPGMAELKTLIDSRENEIMVFPNARLGTHTTTRGRWGPQYTTRNDVDFLGNLLAYLTTELHVDVDEVFAAGYSNGGRMVHELAARFPGRFRAVAEVSGFLGNDAPGIGMAPIASGASLPFYMIHGQDDPTVPVGGGVGSGGVVAFTSAGQSWNRWYANNACTVLPHTDNRPGTRAITTRCRPSVARQTLRREMVLGSDHRWPTFATGFSASAAIVGFFDDQL